MDKKDSSAELEVMGSLLLGGSSQSPKSLQLKLDPEQFGQLRLDLAELMQLAPPKEYEFFGVFAERWLEHIATRRVEPKNERRLMRHLRALFLETEATLTVAMIDEHLGKLPPIANATLNKIRGVGRLAVKLAQAQQLWGGVNPFALVERKKEPKHRYTVLTLEELGKVQAKLRPDRRRQFRMALHLGMRPGEIAALRKSDVDFNAGTITVQRSHSRDTTKTGTERIIPILPAIAGDLLEAMAQAPGEVIFAGADGKQQRADTKLANVIRTAMRAANVGVLSVTWKCRRSGCGFRETCEGANLAPRDCPECNYGLWPVKKVKRFRWYDLRHMCATLHDEHGADLLAISLLLGHSVKGTTERHYVHRQVPKMRAELSRWHLPG